MEEKNTTKPLILDIAEAEEETIDAVNSIIQKHNLPYTLFEPIITGIYRQVLDGKKNEIANASAQYRAQLQKETTKETAPSSGSE